MINDAEDDLKDWRLELDDLPSLDNTGIQTPSQHQTGAETSAVGKEPVTAHQNSGVQRTESTVEGSRISSGTSITTGPVDQSYASNEAQATIPA